VQCIKRSETIYTIIEHSGLAELIFEHGFCLVSSYSEDERSAETKIELILVFFRHFQILFRFEYEQMKYNIIYNLIISNANFWIDTVKYI
jgi:hypothetical protein